MHRKSMEATQTLGHDMIGRGYDKDDEEASGSSSEDEEPESKPKIDEKDEFRSSSIAALRAKAQEHSAKMFGTGFGDHRGSGNLSGKMFGGAGTEMGVSGGGNPSSSDLGRGGGHYVGGSLGPGAGDSQHQQQSVF